MRAIAEKLVDRVKYDVFQAALLTHKSMTGMVASAVRALEYAHELRAHIIPTSGRTSQPRARKVPAVQSWATTAGVAAFQPKT